MDMWILEIFHDFFCLVFGSHREQQAIFEKNQFLFTVSLHATNLERRNSNKQALHSARNLLGWQLISNRTIAINNVFD